MIVDRMPTGDLISSAILPAIILPIVYLLSAAFFDRTVVVYLWAVSPGMAAFLGIFIYGVRDDYSGKWLGAGILSSALYSIVTALIFAVIGVIQIGTPEGVGPGEVVKGIFFITLFYGAPLIVLSSIAGIVSGSIFTWVVRR